MAETFGGIWIKTKGAPIEFNGNLVYPRFCRQLEKGSEFCVSRLKSKSSITQGLRIKVDKGWMIIENKKQKDIVLWADTSPNKVCIQVIGKSPITIKFWNVWRSYTGRMDAWIGNAGMIIDNQDNKTLLSCSDGIGEPNFEDLVINLDFGDLVKPVS